MPMLPYRAVVGTRKEAAPGSHGSVCPAHGARGSHQNSQGCAISVPAPLCPWQLFSWLFLSLRAQPQALGT